MSTSIILLDQNFNANDVDMMVFEPCVLSPGREMRHILLRKSKGELVVKSTQLPENAKVSKILTVLLNSVTIFECFRKYEYP